MAISNEGNPTKERCPNCNAIILYNGNYFCENWSNSPKEDECDWALPHPQTLLTDKKIAFALDGYWEEGEKIIKGEPHWIIHREEPK